MEQNDVRRIGGRVRLERLRRGMTQTELADRISEEWLRRYPDRKPITQKWISALENVEMQLTNLERVVLIAQVFDLPVSALLEDEGPDTTEDHALRLVLRMHGISGAISEDVVREFHLIEEQTRAMQEASPSKPKPPPAPRRRGAKATPSLEDGTPPPTP